MSEVAGKSRDVTLRAPSGNLIEIRFFVPTSRVAFEFLPFKLEKRKGGREGGKFVRIKL